MIFIHLIPCIVLVVLTVLLVCTLAALSFSDVESLFSTLSLTSSGCLLVCTMRRAQQRKRRLMKPSPFCRPTASGEDVQDTVGRSRRRSQRPTEGHNTTLMLVTVVGVFLAVELPQAVTLILLIAQYTFSLNIFVPDTRAAATLICNFVILLSYPTNFFVYCAMSRAFRTTFVELFCGAWRRGSLDMRLVTTDTRATPITRRYVATVDEPPAASRHFAGNDVDGNVTVALVDRCREDASVELIEEQNETCL